MNRKSSMDSCLKNLEVKNLRCYLKPEPNYKLRVLFTQLLGCTIFLSYLSFQAPMESEIPMSDENNANRVLVDCNFKVINWVDSVSKIRDLNEKDIYPLFVSIDPKCAMNVEYMEMLNESIWSILINNTEDFIFAFQSENISKEQLEFILTQLENPINDNINVNFSDLENYCRSPKASLACQKILRSVELAQKKS